MTIKLRVLLKYHENFKRFTVKCCVVQCIISQQNSDNDKMNPRFRYLLSWATTTDAVSATEKRSRKTVDAIFRMRLR